MTLMEYWERASIRPARKAPRDMDMPRKEVMLAKPRQSTRVVSRRISRALVPTTAFMSRSSRNFEKMNMPAARPSIFTAAPMSTLAVSSSCPESMGMSSIIGATIMS